jgi:hypothetical protein
VARQQQQQQQDRRALVAAIVALIGGVGMLYETKGRLEARDVDRGAEINQLRHDMGELRQQLSNCRGSR